MEILSKQLSVLAVAVALAGGCTGRSEDKSDLSRQIIPADFTSMDSTDTGGDQSTIATAARTSITDPDAPQQQTAIQPSTKRSLPRCDNSASDPDGDGYGYENDHSCLVIPSKSPAATENALIDDGAEPQPDNNIDTNERTEDFSGDVPICESAISDPDGDGYGYENEATCLTPSVVVKSESAASQPLSIIDTDAFPNNLHRVTDVILTAGQSNAFANGTRFEPDKYSEDRIDDRILVWTQNNGWKVANPLTQIWEHDLFPARPWDPSTSSNSPGFQIARAIVDADPNRVVAFIPTSTPGQSIHHWRYGAAPYNEIKQRVENALNDIPHKYQLDLIWWMQGESDANASDYYRNALGNLIDNWRSEPWYGNNKYFIANETISFEVNQLFRELRNNDDPYTDYSPAEGLPSIKPNGYHFNSQSYRIIGNRVQQVYRDMRHATGNE